MVKMQKCDTCACQGICKIEDKYRSLSQSIDELNDIAKKDGYFNIEELVCNRYIPKTRNYTSKNAIDCSRQDETATDNDYFNKRIAEYNMNAFVNR